MEIQERLERDLKTALLSGDKKTAETLKGLKNTIQYEAVNLKVSKQEISDLQIQNLLAKESKKRQDAADLYHKVGEADRANSELQEKRIIEQYMPKPLSETEIVRIIEEEKAKITNLGPGDMGRLIGAVKARVGARAEGAVIARLVKQALERQ